ncbi:uncharacterized protein ASCRUDRAFT_81080 [Ascoidea rubescens DSM 1968]|uniref:Uncharacterized protein n=1 Tax=Ascoidea rubescens DSM 1968 TaxID=1344418 RepID=A0A1D2VG89_9ASCO|nr:hypothetical protein ASCRUDRAFT_81080 [Ascoidea rubescens DSM 1968]ODV60684.1 hypothetical protein ASCRUDRAFT_81080 [Ascoidea rubescens DSM 1968]
MVMLLFLSSILSILFILSILSIFSLSSALVALVLDPVHSALLALSSENHFSCSGRTPGVLQLQPTPTRGTVLSPLKHPSITSLKTEFHQFHQFQQFHQFHQFFDFLDFSAPLCI